MSPASVITSLKSLHARAEGKDKLAIEHALVLIEQLGNQVTNLKWLASARYRRSSEKVAPGQLAMQFIEHLMQQAQQSSDAEASREPEPRTPRAKRKSKVTVLPVQTIDKKLPEQQLHCACGETKTDIGYDTRRQVIYTPPKLFMQQERLHKYACRACAAGVVMAAGTPKLIPGSLASSSMLAHLTVAKVIDEMPIERLGKQLARHDGALAASTLYDWFARAGQEVSLLMPRIKESLLASHLISLDDTPMPTKNPAHVNNIQRGRIWLYLGDIDRIAYCRYSEDCKGKHPQEVLRGYGGDIQADGYGGINALFCRPSPPQRVGCNDHARRKFVEAMKLGDARAGDIVAVYAKLYAVERQATAGQVTPQQRLAMRQSMSVPIWPKLEARVTGLARGASSKGALGKACTYWLKQKPALMAYLSHGHLPISNAHVERLLRCVALLRKNALFMGSVEAGSRYAALLTMALNCALCEANPFAYFTWLFDRLAEGLPGSQVLDAMPQAWLRRQQSADKGAP